VPDRRYGNPAQLEDLTRAALTQRGYTLLAGADAGGLRIILQPAVNQAMCDQMAGTSTDMSCQAITEIQARVEGPDAVTDGVDLPSRLRNRCGADRLMTVDQFAVHVAEYIAYAVEGKAKGDRRPVGRC